MRRALIFAASLLALSACATDSDPSPTSAAPPARASSAAPPADEAPTAPEPVADGPCPYLESTAVADANGQRVTKVRTSADKPQPTCFFYRPDGSVQLTVRVYVGTPAAAKTLVDEAAPISESNKAESPAGWKGGSLSSETVKGAVYAVAKEGTAVVVNTNQEQTI
ncbi:MAG: DUF2020 domain-containing protein, partial [Actinomycetota bacterium]|nr:DUF2020 domain-containing protein [Actinomycetota bacterium]